MEFRSLEFRTFGLGCRSPGFRIFGASGEGLVVQSLSELLLESSH